MIVFIALAAVLVMVAIFAVVIRGSLGLLSKRLQDDPDLTPSADQLDDDELPIGVEY